ncbi:hypothetical protein ACFYZ9_19510 [Streptomyces sp. NPDC001691]|uniref:hypothetical protein n=1 Tax=unclassified Streptomyces TaxID=2593676 RepID=UPI001676AFE6|nr:hypothetical protein [Streptomyces sp. SDr-06]
MTRLQVAFRSTSDSPIYDTVVRQWLQQGREVPRAVTSVSWRPQVADLFERA